MTMKKSLNNCRNQMKALMNFLKIKWMKKKNNNKKKKKKKIWKKLKVRKVFYQFLKMIIRMNKSKDKMKKMYYFINFFTIFKI